MEAVLEAENVTLAFMDRFGSLYLRMCRKIYNRGLLFSSFRIRGHRINLRDRGCFRG